MQTLRHKRIIFSYYNAFDGDNLGSMNMPYDRNKATRGYYSKYWKTMKEHLANTWKLDKHWVRVKVNIIFSYPHL